jgi:hypothetical protein
MIVGHNPVHGPFKNGGKNRKRTYKPVWKWQWSGRTAVQWAMENFGPYLGSRRLNKLKEVIRAVESAPYKSENFRRAYLGIKTGTRFCTGPCGQEKPLNEFYKRSSHCRPCEAERAKIYRQRAA